MKSYAKPELITHGNMEDITLNTGDSSERDFVILTGLPAGLANITIDGVDGSLSLQEDISNGNRNLVPNP